MAEIVGSVSKNSSYYKYYIDVSETNIDTANNTSVVTATLKIYTNYSSTLAVRYASATHTITIDGTDYTITTGEYTLGSYKTVTLGSASKTVTHNTDGSKTVSISATSSDLAQGNGWGPYSGSASGQVTLTNIPRASSVTCADGNIGSSTTININRASSNFMHTIKYSFGTLSGTIITKTSETSIGWTIPTSFYAQIPNSTNGKGTITCETYNGDTLIGTKTCTFNAFVINSNPSITATVEDVNEKTISLTGDSNKLVKYFSNAKVEITATAKNSATISSQKVVCGDGKTSTSATSTIEAVESGKFTVSCVDSRGLPASEIIEKELVEYIKLALTEVSLERESTTSNVVNAVIKGNYYNNSFGAIANTLELKWRYRLSGGTWNEYNTITPTIDGNTFSYSASLGEDYDYQNEYEFEIVATDKLMPDTITRTVRKGIPIIDIGENDVSVNGETKATQFTGPLNGNASSSSRVADRGNVTAETGTTKPALSGISLQRAYNNGYPSTYGNVLNLLGAGGSQLFLGWEGNALRGRLYYRSIRDNTNSWSSWGHIATAVTLYDNSSGTTGTITLSESVANFSYLEIYIMTSHNNDCFTFKVASPNGKTTVLNWQEIFTTSNASASNWYVMGRRIQINGTSITTYNNQYGLINISGDYLETGNRGNIVRVIGYR